jgi:hypothetical protein
MVWAQASMATGHRVRKTQPEGGFIGDGMSPCSGTWVRLRVGSGTGRCGEQRLGVGMARLGVDLARRAPLHDAAEIHHHHFVAEIFDDTEIVGDEQHGQAEALLELAQEVEHLRLHRNVERRHRLVGDDEIGLDRQRPGDADALALSAGEFMREAARIFGRQPDQGQQFGDALAARLAPRG